VVAADGTVIVVTAEDVGKDVGDIEALEEETEADSGEAEAVVRVDTAAKEGHPGKEVTGEAAAARTASEADVAAEIVLNAETAEAPGHTEEA